MDIIVDVQEAELSERRILGSGSFGTVYKAKWCDMSVAVKYFNHSRDPFTKREIGILSRLQSLQHPNIINLYATGCNGPQTFMIAELAPFSLDYILHDTADYSYSVDHVISWSLQLARALECCHKEDIIHRDIKPSNMLLFDEGRLFKVCDFGTAKLVSNSIISSFIGTPYYLAPEVLEGIHSSKCDIYSFAVTLWEMITRHKPTFDLNQKGSPHPFLLMSEIAKGQRYPNIVGIPRFLWEMITRCWSNDSDDRLTAGELVKKLNRIARWFRMDMPLDKDYSGLFEKALNEGYVNTKWTKLSFIGPPASGKSSAMKLLLNEPPCSMHDSTSVANASKIRKVEISSLTSTDINSTCTWDKVDHGSLKDMIAGAIKSINPSTSTLIMKSLATDNLPNQSYGELVPSAYGIEETSDDEEYTSPTHSYGIEEMDFLSPSDINDENFFESMTNVSREIIHTLSTTEKSEALYNAHWIYAVDTGGQAAFLDIAPALLRYNSINIVTHKLSEKLSDETTFMYSVKGKQIGLPIKRHITHQQLLESSIRSVSSIRPPDLHQISLKNSEEIRRPTILVLGTFYDKIEESGESLDDKNKALKSFQQCPSVLKYRRSLIFPVNTIARGEEEIKMANIIRRKVCNSYIEAELPARWFLFQLELNELKATSQVVTKSMCIEVGAKLMMNHKEVETALMYFHDLTVILYFHGILPNIVFLHPQPLFDKLSELISISFADAVDCLEDEGLELPPNAHELLKNKGLFEREVLDCLPDGFRKEKYTADDFLKLLESVFIIGHLPKQDCYFIPCVLPTCLDLDELKQNHMKQLDPIVLTWNTESIPQGVFPALIVNLLQRNECPTFELAAEQQYRNAFQLTSYSLGGSLLLVDSIYWLEVYYSNPSAVKSCFNIRCAIDDGIEKVVDKFHYDPDPPTQCFLCNCSTAERNPHICRLNDDKTTLTCSLYGHLSFEIEKIRQKPWLKQSGSAIKLYINDKPSVKSLLQLLSCISAQWREIGLALEVDDNFLKGLYGFHMSDKLNLNAVLSRWIDMDNDVTWSAIIKAIEGPIVDNKRVATEICNFLEGK